ncbi:hypothetical protein GJ744_005993 [Endocarpon pusillum]|uniref:Major facilitator superfamily (MFS) profile domain-containing protein n=1 Tax=Endocarpon pusillum TaxID=364733 RepID=A0A8H7A725_9EURO|nr:hypothetical protein GJ744_005993 [Endocarpon pusillum]
MQTLEHRLQINSNEPDCGYGWVCVAACFTINAFTWGVVSSYGIYLAHYLSNETFTKARPIDFAFIGGLNFAVAMLAAPAVTALVRRYEIHLPMSLGILIFGIAYVSASFSWRIWQLYLSQGVLVGLGVGFLYIPSIAILSQWFSTKRSLANGISAAGSGVGGLIFSLSTGATIEHLGLAWSLRLVGVMAVTANTLATIFIRSRNRVVQPASIPFDIVLLRRYEVFLLLTWAFISMFGYIALLFSLSDYAISIGLSRDQAIQITAYLNLGTAVGRPVIGSISDRYGRIEIAGLLTLLCGLCCFVLWLPFQSFAVTVVFAIISGAILGVFWVTIGPLCVEVAGLEELPSLLSLAWLTTVLPTAFSETIALQLRRPGMKREYLYPQIFSGLSYILASFCLWELRRHRKSLSRTDAARNQSPR